MRPYLPARLPSALPPMMAAAWLLLASCGGSTTMRAEWRDSEYHGGRIDNVMTIGLFRQAIHRRLLEEELVAQLRRHQVTAISSASLLSDQQQLDKAAIEAEVKRRGIDAVLITRLLDVERSEQVVEATTVQVPHAYYNSLYSYYYTVSEELQTPAYTRETRVVVLESNLYDTATGKLVWTAVSETFDPKSDQDAIKDIGNLIVKSLEKHGLL